MATTIRARSPPYSSGPTRGEKFVIYTYKFDRDPYAPIKTTEIFYTDETSKSFPTWMRSEAAYEEIEIVKKKGWKIE